MTESGEEPLTVQLKVSRKFCQQRFICTPMPSCFEIVFRADRLGSKIRAQMGHLTELNSYGWY